MARIVKVRSSLLRSPQSPISLSIAWSRLPTSVRRSGARIRFPYSTALNVSGGPTLCDGHADVGGVVVEAELGEQRAQHRDVHAPGRRRGGPAAAAAVLLELAAVGGDRVPGHVADDGRAAELLTQRVGEAGVDRAVLPGARRPRGAGGDQLADRVEVRLEQLLAGRESGGDEGERRGDDQLGDVDERGAICERGHLG
jgi:hypothetical protein